MTKTTRNNNRYLTLFLSSTLSISHAQTHTHSLSPFIFNLYLLLYHSLILLDSLLSQPLSACHYLILSPLTFYRSYLPSFQSSFLCQSLKLSSSLLVCLSLSVSGSVSACLPACLLLSLSPSPFFLSLHLTLLINLYHPITLSIIAQRLPS